MKHTISFFYPMYNEEKNVKRAIERAEKVLEEVAEDYEIIIVDDGSQDKTFEIAKKEAERNPRIRPIKHEKNKGYGGALQTGFKESRMDLVFFTDGDNQFDPGELKLLLPYIEEYDFVIGYRIDRKDPLLRKLFGKGWTIITRILLGVKVRDIDCAFKLFKRDIVKDITIESHGAAINPEIMFKLINKGYKFKEVGVHHFPRKEGKQTGANIKVIFRAFKEILKLWWRERIIGRSR